MKGKGEHLYRSAARPGPGGEEDLGCTVKYLTPAEYAKFLAEEDKVAAIVAKQIKLEKK